MAVIELLYKDRRGLRLPNTGPRPGASFDRRSRLPVRRATSGTGQTTAGGSKPCSQREEEELAPMGSLSTPIRLTLAQIHHLVGGTLHGNGARCCHRCPAWTTRRRKRLAFICNDKAAKVPGRDKAGGLLVHRHLPDRCHSATSFPIPFSPLRKWPKRFYAAAAPRGIAAEVTKGPAFTIGDDPSIWPFVTLGDRGHDRREGDALSRGLRRGRFHGGRRQRALSQCGRPGRLSDRRQGDHSQRDRDRSDGFGYVQHEGRHQKIPSSGA